MAANRICKVLKVNQDNERLMEEYERLASDVSSIKEYFFHVWVILGKFFNYILLTQTNKPIFWSVVCNNLDSRTQSKISFYLFSYWSGFEELCLGWRADNLVIRLLQCKRSKKNTESIEESTNLQGDLKVIHHRQVLLPKCKISNFLFLIYSTGWSKKQSWRPISTLFRLSWGCRTGQVSED